ncbi:mechanosensitive ion channel MscS [Legionella geestiana]|uniref:Small-conductance mechanosensitive channel n=1 Tax=Legionella geestiana TaxID=45065 RepID=A0A0W0TST5_9GAMM|nr:mechanosensitive ion channel family protein [Legionella geestiana]KTC98769.1 mechanosensitive ion channel MscS [Legionella geestiana]QBS12778.1 mechanosensitive ion channel family protein [Legionella geestiana]QDQ39504.1 mechanosensitive ion channel family protein [Legionella geestiana]STX54746.1 mechanosensitive ion channel MscS [Legionella geestiana]
MQFLEHIKWLNLFYAILLFSSGYILAKWAGTLIERTIEKHFSKHQAMLAHRLAFYLFFVAFAVCALQQLGFNLSVLLGAAGIFTVALSFASQTAASNLVSGVFLLFERPFKVGDQVQVNTVSGTVEAIDLLSTKIRTSDNRLVRVPNESLIKSQITNLSYYPTRRVDIPLIVSWKTDIDALVPLLHTLALETPHVLKNPEPQVVIDQFNESSIQLMMKAWTKKANVSEVTNTLRTAVKHLFDEKGIETPSPQITLTREAL